MRIRSIRPEFWSSEDITALPWNYRLIFIGLWSYVDDNGVGRDVEKLIVADLFPLEENQTAALKQIRGALTELSSRGLVTRYTVDGKPFVHVTTFSTNQVINRPSRGRYPLPTSENAELAVTLTEGSVSPHVNEVIGEGEKGRRGEVKTRPSAHADDEFEAFWKLYPRRVSKGQAAKAYAAALKKTGAPAILAAITAQVPKLTAVSDPKFIPMPATWLNGERWLDEAPSLARPCRADFPEDLIG